MAKKSKQIKQRLCEQKISLDSVQSGDFATLWANNSSVAEISHSSSDQQHIQPSSNLSHTINGLRQLFDHKAQPSPNCLPPENYYQPQFKDRFQQLKKLNEQTVNAVIDFHGFYREQTCNLLNRTVIDLLYDQQLRKANLMLIHGKGNHSLPGNFILRDLLRHWCMLQVTYVAAYHQPANNSGATLVALLALSTKQKG